MGQTGKAKRSTVIPPHQLLDTRATCIKNGGFLTINPLLKKYLQLIIKVRTLVTISEKGISTLMLLIDQK